VAGGGDAGRFPPRLARLQPLLVRGDQGDNFGVLRLLVPEAFQRASGQRQAGCLQGILVGNHRHLLSGGTAREQGGDGAGHTVRQGGERLRGEIHLQGIG